MKKIVIPESESSYKLIKRTADGIGIISLIASIAIILTGLFFLDSDGIEVAIYFFISAVFFYLIAYVLRVSLLGLSELVKHSYIRHRYQETNLLEQDIIFEIKKN